MQTLFCITANHSYFSNGEFTDAQLVPCANTLTLMYKYRLAIKQFDNQFVVYLTAPRSDLAGFVNYLLDAAEVVCLQFSLQYSPNTFNAITQLPIDWSGELALSSQLLAAQSDSISSSTDQALLIDWQQKSGPSRNNSIAQVSIFLADIVTSVRQQQVLNFQINFKARETYWQYLLINESNTQLSAPKITDGAEFEFEKSEWRELDNGQLALCFHSGKQTFPMQQRPQQSFNLINQETVNGNDTRVYQKPLLTGLPTPSSEQLVIKKINGKQYVYSEMYVYL